MRPSLHLRILLTQLLRVFYLPKCDLRKKEFSVEIIQISRPVFFFSISFFTKADKELKAQGEKDSSQTRRREKILKEQRVPRGRSVFIDQDSRQIQKFSDFSISDFSSLYSFFDWSQ